MARLRGISSSLLTRALSTPAVPPNVLPSPTGINKDMAFGIQSATSLYVNHGVTKAQLKEISKGAGDTKTLVTRWQQMMGAFIGAQLHVLNGCGYSGDETGLYKYNEQLAEFMQSVDKDEQEELRISNRDLWRSVLSSAFDLSEEEIAEVPKMSLVEARNAYHKVAEKMIQPNILEAVSRQAALLKETDKPDYDKALRHQIVQETLVNDVYLEGNPSLTEELGFGSGERGYVLFQYTIAEYQNDPLVAQYIGSAMTNLIKSAGIEMPMMGNTQ